MKIDAHQHFWHYTEDQYSWISDAMGVLQRDFLPNDLRQELEQFQLDGCVAVQARQSLEETQWLLALAEQFDFIRGVVGWIDITSDTLTDQLALFSSANKLKGFRHILQDEPEPYFMLQTDFIRGLQTLAQHDYCYDILVFARQLPQACELVHHLPAMRLVLDHIGKPDIQGGQWQSWQLSIAELASHSHVYCKLSGMITEADWAHWKPAHFERYLDHVFECFGPERVMFGSDWPVCQLAGEYSQVYTLIKDYVERKQRDHEAEIFGGNACRFYRL